MITVIGEHVICNHRKRLEWVGNSTVSTQCSGSVDIGTVRVESEFVDFSQASARVEWSRSIICVESEDWVGEGGEQGISRGEVRQRWIAL